MKMTRLAISCALIFGASGNSFAAGPTEVEVLKQQMEVMQKQMAGLQSKLDAIAATPQAGQVAGTPAAGGNSSNESPLSTRIGGADVTLYGFVDLSADVANDGKERLNQVS